MPAEYESTEFDLESVEISEVFEGVKAVLLAPVLLPLVSTVNQPLVKAVIRESIAFSERCRDAVADAQERLDDIFAEVQAEAEAKRRSPHAEAQTAMKMDDSGGDTNGSEQTSEHRLSENSTPSQAVLVPRESRAYRQSVGSIRHDTTQTAFQLSEMVEELNAQIRWLTNDILDLRILTTTALGAFALRQMVVRGLRLDEIPWYVAGWYALDTFVKFHPNVMDTGVSPQTANLSQNSAPQTIDIQ
jgi:hypothetical protein